MSQTDFWRPFIIYVKPLCLKMSPPCRPLHNAKMTNLANICILYHKYIRLIFLRGYISRVYDLLLYNTQQTDHWLHRTLDTIMPWFEPGSSGHKAADLPMSQLSLLTCRSLIYLMFKFHNSYVCHHCFSLITRLLT